MYPRHNTHDHKKEKKKRKKKTTEHKIVTGKNRQKISKPGQEIATEEKTDGKKKTKASATGKKRGKKKTTAQGLSG